MCIARATSLRVGTQCVYDVVNNDDVLYILFIGFVRKKKNIIYCLLLFFLIYYYVCCRCLYYVNVVVRGGGGGEEGMRCWKKK